MNSLLFGGCKISDSSLSLPLLHPNTLDMLLNNFLHALFLCFISAIYPVQAVKYYRKLHLACTSPQQLTKPVSLSGTKTGNLYHNTLSNFTNVTPIANFSFSASQPLDMATGSPAGKLQFVPIIVEKEMDGASANLALLLSTRQFVTATFYGLENGTGMLYPRAISISGRRIE